MIGLIISFVIAVVGCLLMWRFWLRFNGLTDLDVGEMLLLLLIALVIAVGFTGVMSFFSLNWEVIAPWLKDLFML